MDFDMKRNLPRSLFMAMLTVLLLTTFAGCARVYGAGDQPCTWTPQNKAILPQHCMDGDTAQYRNASPLEKAL
jgi:hypothetical protein